MPESHDPLNLAVPQILTSQSDVRQQTAITHPAQGVQNVGFSTGQIEVSQVTSKDTRKFDNKFTSLQHKRDSRHVLHMQAND